MAIKIDDLPEKYQKQVRDQIALPFADVEQGSRNAPLRKEETPRFNRQVSISVHSKRHRRTDPDGACFKYTLDAIVDTGILQDDTPEEVREIKKTQEKIPRSKMEETIIFIEEVGDG